MTREQLDIHIGLVDFAEPTFLLVGNSTSFDWLARQLANHSVVMLEDPSGQGIVSLKFIPISRSGQLIREGDDFEWQISKTEALSVAEQLQGLVASDRPAHAYLDPTINTTNVQVVASVGEYDPDNVFD